MSVPKDIYNVDNYTDVELYNILDLNNPSDRELEAKILHMISKYENMENESASKMVDFFNKIYDRFFYTEEDVEKDAEDEKTHQLEQHKPHQLENQSHAKENITIEGFEGLENMTITSKTDTANNLNQPEKIKASTAKTTKKSNAPAGAYDSSPTDPNNRSFSYQIPIDYSKDNLNPLLKQTTKRIVVVDSQYRENKNTPSNSFTFNLSTPLKDVVSLKLYSFQIPYTWYTINNNYGSNFFYLKGNTDGIIDNGNDIKIEIESGNYTAQNLITSINNSIQTLQTNSSFTDICFGTTGITYDNINSKSQFTFDIKKIFNEGDYEMYFPYWDSPQIPSTNYYTDASYNRSIPGFLGYNFNYYSPNVVYGLYNQIQGYDISGLATGYSLGNNVFANYLYPKTDDTVSIYYLDSSNNYFDIAITDINSVNTIDASNATIYGGLRITLSRLKTNVYYTRNELVNELNYQLSINPFLDNTYSYLHRVYEPLYLYYIDFYTFQQKNLTTPPYLPSPAYPYLYVPETIINPFHDPSTIPPNYPYLPLYTLPILQPDPTNTNLILPNPFYNAKILDPSANNTPVYPWVTEFIYNPFDPTGRLIPNPYDISNSPTMMNPYLPLFTSPKLSYMYYIDIVTLQSQNLTVPPYVPTPTFPYVYIPQHIPNPFYTANTITNQYAYYPLYTEPTIQPDPTSVSSIITNPFYNPKIKQPNQSPSRLSYPFNTPYIPNPFDPNLNMIPNPFDISNNATMINPYYIGTVTTNINYKYYIDPGTYLRYYNNGNSTLTTINSYVYLPTYPYMYLPRYILNPFTFPNRIYLQTNLNYAYRVLFATPFIQPNPNNLNLVLPNPFYNPKILDPNAEFSGPLFPFDSPTYITNPFDPTTGLIPNPYYNINNNIPYLDDSSPPPGYMLNPYYNLVTVRNVQYKFYIDSYTLSNYTYPGFTTPILFSKPYTFGSVSPYLYVPQLILNPFTPRNLSNINANYSYYPLFTSSAIYPNPTNTSLSYANPYYNAKLANPTQTTTRPSYSGTFVTANGVYILNPFDANTGLLPNPYDNSNNNTTVTVTLDDGTIITVPPGYMVNPYYATAAVSLITYKFYIDLYTFLRGPLMTPLSTKYYSFNPTYPYLYMPSVILNPFNTNQSNLTPNHPYWPLFTQPLIEPDPTNPSLQLLNPFYNAKLLNPSANNSPQYPFNTQYITNPFDPNGVGIVNPYYIANNSQPTTQTLANGSIISIPNGYILNPYYPLTAVQNIKYKFYIDSYTYVQNNLFGQPFCFSPLYPYLYSPTLILNPFNDASIASITPSYPYYSLYTTPIIVPDPTNPSIQLPNPFFNAKILNPLANNTPPQYPFNTPYILNPFDPDAGFIPSPYDNSNNTIFLPAPIGRIDAGKMVNPYFSLLNTSNITLKFYIDPYTFTYNNLYVNSIHFVFSPIYPYVYVPQYIVNPFYNTYIQGSLITSFYPYYSLFTTPLIEPDPTNPSVQLPNPFFNGKILDPSANNAPQYPFNAPYIFNPFDPNGGLIPSPYYSASNAMMINPYYALVTAPNINYKFYIDSYTYQQANLNTNPNYIINPVYPYLYVPQTILNPFNTANRSSITTSHPYYPLYTRPLIAPDPTQPSLQLPNPFYNAKLLDPSANNTPQYPFISTYIPNPFDPNAAAIPNPYNISNNTTMINPYYNLVTKPNINYKFYIDSNTLAQQINGNTYLNTYYTITPIYPYLYVPQFIMNPFNTSSFTTIRSQGNITPYWPLYIQDIIAPNPADPTIQLSNPFYNAALVGRSQPVPDPNNPYNLLLSGSYIPNLFDPNLGFIPNPIYNANNTLPNFDGSTNPSGYMINPYYQLITTQRFNYKFYIDLITFQNFLTFGQTIGNALTATGTAATAIGQKILFVGIDSLGAGATASIVGSVLPMLGIVSGLEGALAALEATTVTTTLLYGITDAWVNMVIAAGSYGTTAQLAVTQLAVANIQGALSYANDPTTNPPVPLITEAQIALATANGLMNTYGSQIAGTVYAALAIQSAASAITPTNGALTLANTIISTAVSTTSATNASFTDASNNLVPLLSNALTSDQTAFTTINSILSDLSNNSFTTISLQNKLATIDTNINSASGNISLASTKMASIANSMSTTFNGTANVPTTISALSATVGGILATANPTPAAAIQSAILSVKKQLIDLYSLGPIVVNLKTLLTTTGNAYTASQNVLATAPTLLTDISSGMVYLQTANGANISGNTAVQGALATIETQIVNSATPASSYAQGDIQYAVAIGYATQIGMYSTTAGTYANTAGNAASSVSTNATTAGTYAGIALTQSVTYNVSLGIVAGIAATSVSYAIEGTTAALAMAAAAEGITAALNSAAALTMIVYGSAAMAVSVITACATNDAKMAASLIGASNVGAILSQLATATNALNTAITTASGVVSTVSGNITEAVTGAATMAATSIAYSIPSTYSQDAVTSTTYASAVLSDPSSGINNLITNASSTLSYINTAISNANTILSLLQQANPTTSYTSYLNTLQTNATSSQINLSSVGSITTTIKTKTTSASSSANSSSTVANGAYTTAQGALGSSTDPNVIAILGALQTSTSASSSAMTTIQSGVTALGSADGANISGTTMATGVPSTIATAITAFSTTGGAQIFAAIASASALAQYTGTLAATAGAAANQTITNNMQNNAAIVGSQALIASNLMTTANTSITTISGQLMAAGTAIQGNTFTTQVGAIITKATSVYTPIPIYSYIYLPETILNPFDPSNNTIIMDLSANFPYYSYPFFPLFIEKYIYPDPTNTNIFYNNPYYNPIFIGPTIYGTNTPNPFYNMLLYQESIDPSYNIPYVNEISIYNYFDANQNYIPNPYYYTKYPSIFNNVSVPTGHIINPYISIFSSNSTVPHTPIGDLITTNTPGSINDTFKTVANPAYNSHIITATSGAISIPSIITNGNTIVNPGYNTFTSTIITDPNNTPNNINNVTRIPNPGYNPNAITQGTQGTISMNYQNAAVAINPAYNPLVIYDNSNNNINQVMTISNPGYNATTVLDNSMNNITSAQAISNPAYNPYAIYDNSNNDITKAVIIPNPAYNSSVITDISNNDATKYSIITNPTYNPKAIHDDGNQLLSDIEIIPNPYYNPDISNNIRNVVSNWLGSSYSHYELRLKLNRLTMPIVNSAYSKKSVPNVINQKIIVKFPDDRKVWLGTGSAFSFNDLINPYPLSVMIAESPIYEKKVYFNSTPTITFKCIKPFYDVTQNNYIATITPNIDNNNNIIAYNFSDFMNKINNSLTIINTNSVNASNPSGVFKIGANPSYIDSTSSSTLLYKNSSSYLNFSVDINKLFNNYDYYLDLGTGYLIQSLGLTQIQLLAGYDTSQNPILQTIYTDVSKNTYQNNQDYGGYGIDFNGNLWVGVGQDITNTIVYSRDYGNTWTGATSKTGTNNALSSNTMFTQRGNQVKYNSNIWVATGKSGNTTVTIGGSIVAGNSLAYSLNGNSWTGLGGNVFLIEGKGITCNAVGNIWVATGQGGNTIAKSSNGISWQGIINSPFDTYTNGTGNGVYWDSSYNLFVAVGTDGSGNTIAKSTNGNNWQATTNPFGTSGIGYAVACNGNTWVAVGTSNTGNCIAYAQNSSLNWQSVNTGNLFKYGTPTTVSYNGNLWVVGGSGSDILATSTNGISWTTETTNTKNTNNTFVEGVNTIKWNSSKSKWVALGNCGFSGNSIAYGNIISSTAIWTVSTNQPFSSGLTNITTYNIPLSINASSGKTLVMYGIFPVNANGYRFIAGNFINLIPNPFSANKFSSNELIQITAAQANVFYAANTVELAALVNEQFSVFQDLDGDYVLNASNIVLEVSGNQVYATLNITINKYLTQQSYNMILNDPSDVSFNSNPTTALWQDTSNIWWNYLKIPYWNWPLYYTSGSTYILNDSSITTANLSIVNSISTIQNISTSIVRPNSITIRDVSFSDVSTGVSYPPNNKIIIQPQTVVSNPLIAGDPTSGSPNANTSRKPGWENILPINGLTTTNVSDATSIYNGYGYNSIIITIPNGDYSADELISYINKKFISSPYTPTTSQTTSPLLTYNNKCITFSSNFSFTPVSGIGNITSMFFNINMVYNSGDYLLDFYDPTINTNCSNNLKNTQVTSWDSTMGWILGFRNFTIYPLSTLTPNTTTQFSTNALLQVIANNIVNGIYDIGQNQLQSTVDPAQQSYILTLKSDNAVSVNIYNYFLITLDDFNQSHLNNGLVTTNQTETDIPLPSYANRTLSRCDPTTKNFIVSNLNTNSTSNDTSVTNIQRNLTQKQIYAAQEILNMTKNTAQSTNSTYSQGAIVKQNTRYYSVPPSTQDVFGLIPLKLSGQQNNTVYIDYSGTLQNQERIYFGPVNIQRMSVSLVNDHGELVDLNGANWAFSFICEQLYQQKKT